MEVETAPPTVDGLPPAVGGGCNCENGAATKLQKVYRSYRTRRKLADSAVVEGLWWQALDFARLSHSTVSFFDESKPETVAARWNRVNLNASKVGQGLSRDGKALKLALLHWLEAIDPRHRYGENMHFYYVVWCQSQAGQPFFYCKSVKTLNTSLMREKLSINSLENHLIQARVLKGLNGFLL